MIESGNLSEFNHARCRDISACNDNELATILSKNSKSFPNIYLLLTETTKFYTEHFSDIQKYIRREKRQIIFDTPSRVSITHEYTVEGMGNLPQDYYFLFNTRERLSWLTIFLEDKRVSIASRAKIAQLLVKKLETELENLATLLNASKEDVALRLYEASDGKPCFVEYNQKEQKGQQSLLFRITFFDSIRNKAPQKHNKRWWSPLQEKLISYNYSTMSGDANAWIYFKSPTNFVISVDHNAQEGQYEASPSNDDEIKSLVLKPKGKKLSVDFKISIDVPNALKVWYNSMLFIALLGCICGSLLLGGYKSFAFITDKMIETFSNCSYAIIAALIATRGWLMSEEQVMKKMSNWYTGIIAFFILLVSLLSFVSNTNPANTNEPQNSIQPNSILSDSLSHDSKKNDSIPNMPSAKNSNDSIKGKVDETVNDTTGIKQKVNDSQDGA